MPELEVLIQNIKRFLGIPDAQSIPIRKDDEREIPPRSKSRED